MTSWTGKPCQGVNCLNKGRKDKKRLHLKYCYRCSLAVRRAKSKGAHSKAIMQRYGLSAEDYAALYEFQGGRCYICRRATGRTRNLSVDHDHSTMEVRGLLCRPCNTMLGHARDLIAFFQRAIDYLRDPPYARMKRGRNSRTIE